MRAIARNCIARMVIAPSIPAIRGLASGKFLGNQTGNNRPPRHLVSSAQKASSRSTPGPYCCLISATESFLYPSYLPSSPHLAPLPPISQPRLNPVPHPASTLGFSYCGPHEEGVHVFQPALPLPLEAEGFSLGGWESLAPLSPGATHDIEPGKLGWQDSRGEGV